MINEFNPRLIFMIFKKNMKKSMSLCFLMRRKGTRIEVHAGKNMEYLN